MREVDRVTAGNQARCPAGASRPAGEVGSTGISGPTGGVGFAGGEALAAAAPPSMRALRQPPQR